jgi:hypothetical protein
MKLNEPQNIEQNFDELELVAEKAGELNDRVGKIENELGAQTKTLESAAMVLDAAIKGLGALKHQVLENDIGALQLALNDKTAHLAREIGRFESAVAEIDRRAEAGDEQLAASLRDIALGLRSSFDAKSAEIAEWSVRVEREIAAHSVALAAIPPVIKGADAKPFNPRGEWQAGMVVNSLDVVSYNGSSYISNEDGNTDKPTRSTKYTTLAKRSGNGAGGATDFGSLTGTILPAQVVPGSATYAVGDVLYAGTTGALSKLTAGSSGQLLSTQGAGAAPRWVSATGGAGDVNGPASATDNAIVRFDGTGGKTVQNSAVTIADTTGDIAGASSLTAPATTALTLAGGSTGASLVLGQGTSGAATLTSPGNPNVTTTGNNPISFQVYPAGTGSSAALSVFNNSSLGSAQYGQLSSAQNGGSPEFRVITGANAGITPALVFSPGGEKARLTSTGNLLIGTTTDATSLAGGLVVNGSGAGATSSSTSTGALRVTGGVGVSGAMNVGSTVTAGGNVILAQGTYVLLNGAADLNSSLVRLAGNTILSAGGDVILKSSGATVLTGTSTGAATFAGAVSLSTAGTTVSIKSGANAAAGTVTLVGGAGTITSTAIDVNTVIVMSVKTMSGTVGDHLPSVSVAAGSATIDGSSSDNSTYNWVALKVN